MRSTDAISAEQVWEDDGGQLVEDTATPADPSAPPDTARRARTLDAARSDHPEETL